MVIQKSVVKEGWSLMRGSHIRGPTVVQITQWRGLDAVLISVDHSNFGHQVCVYVGLCQCKKKCPWARIVQALVIKMLYNA